jgi:hypothetical protein
MLEACITPAVAPTIGEIGAARLGHASAAETLDTYSHLWPDSEDRTRSAVDEVLVPGRYDSSRTIAIT